MKQVRWFSSIVILLIFFSCKKDDGKKNVITIEGFALTDGFGNSFGTSGNAADDWQIRNWSELSSAEQSFLNFSDNIDLANTSGTTLYGPLAYPNPLYNRQTIEFRSVDSVKLKFAVVDESGHVFRTLAHKIKGGKAFAVDFSDSTLFPSKKSLRYYYSFSALGQPNFKAGYGDVKVCRNTSPSFYIDCFQ